MPSSLSLFVLDLLKATPATTRRSAGATVSFQLRCAALLLPALLSASAAVDEASEGGALRLPGVEVVEKPLASLPEVDRFAGSATIVGDQQLRDLNALDIASALRRTPGITISRYNQVGAFGGTEGGALFLRGLGASRPGGEIKTTVDGVPKLNGVFNHPLLDLMSVDLASRIEVRPRATPLEVGNTFAAVNVVTPRVEKAGTIARTHLAAGSFGTLVERVDIGAREGTVDAYVSQSLRRSDGHRPDSGGRLENYYLHLGWAPAPGWDFTYKLNHTDNRATDPGVEQVGPPNPAAAMVPSTRGETYATSDWLQIATLSHSHGAFAGSLKAYHNAGEANWSRRAYSKNGDSLNDWRNQGLRWRELVRAWSGAEIVAGADLDFNRGKTVTVPATPTPELVFGPKTTRLLSPYVGLSQSLALGGGWTLTPSAGVRHYDHSEFDAQWAPQAGLVLADRRTRLHASASRALNYPGLEVQAFSAIVIPALGQSWRSLDPERLDQYEIGASHAITEATTVAVTAFRNRARNRYVVVPPPPPPPRYLNLEAYRTQGVEAEVQTSISSALAVFAGASFLDSSAADLPYAPHATYTGGVNWRLAPGWFLSADGSYVGAMRIESNARTANALNTVRVGAHFLLNARLSHRFSWGGSSVAPHRGEVYVSGENLTDRGFAYRPGYPIPGINALAGVRLEW